MKSACPAQAPVLWLMRDWIAAMAGELAEVPPTPVITTAPLEVRFALEQSPGFAQMG